MSGPRAAARTNPRRRWLGEREAADNPARHWLTAAAALFIPTADTSPGFGTAPFGTTTFGG